MFVVLPRGDEKSQRLCLPGPANKPDGASSTLSAVFLPTLSNEDSGAIKRIIRSPVRCRASPLTPRSTEPPS